MKTKLLLTTVSAIFLLHSAFGQGALTPPGAPAPTMKTLTQIEPRTPISAVPFNITQPGSYYLTGNLTVSSGNAITIATNGVTLDLGGWMISSTTAPAAGYAIQVNGGLRNLAIYNGVIQGGVTNNGSGVYGGSGFAYGIFSPSTLPVNTRISGITVSGCQLYGINVGYGDSTVVESCTVRTVGNFGIIASLIKNSVATDCGSTAILGDQVSNCRGESTGGGTGINAISSAENCYGSSVSGNGIAATTAQNCNGLSSGNGDGINTTTALNCNGTSSGGGRGIYASDLANGCRGSSNSGPGIFAFIINSCRGISTSGTPLLTTHNVNSF